MSNIIITLGVLYLFIIIVIYKSLTQTGGSK